MTTLGVNVSTQDPTHDYTGLTSGHPRPAKVIAAQEYMLEAWANHSAAIDRYEGGGDSYPRAMVLRKEIDTLLQSAIAADAEYYRIFRVWAASLQECACRPGRPNESDYTCAACRAKQELDDDGEELPY